MTISLADRLRSFLALTSDLGLSDGARLFLREIGVRTYQSAAFPGLHVVFEVQFDPVWRWISRGVRERGLLRFSQEHIETGSTVIDVGAHVGESALLFSHLVGSSGRVIAFEPDPVACASLRKNLELNGITNVSVEEQVVSDVVGEAHLATDRFGSGLASIVPGPSHPRREVSVPSTTLDEYCEAHGLSPDWIKVDAEGAEPLIIDGMQRLIESAHPSVILEFHSDNLTDEERRGAWSAITRRALSVVVLEGSGEDRDYLREIPRGDVPDRGFLIVSINY